MSRFSGAPSTSVHLGKRKRRVSDLPSDTINPLSHSPGVLKQFRTSGLPDTKHPPSDSISSFPHSAFEEGRRNRTGRTTHAERDLDALWAAALGSKGPASSGTRNTKEKLLTSLEEAVQLLWSRGDIARARKVMGVLVRARTDSRHDDADVRRFSRWALGAELLLREQESASEVSGAPAVNTVKVRNYVTTLISMYPWGLQPARLAFAVDFWRALFSTRVYGVYAEQLAALVEQQPSVGNETGLSPRSNVSTHHEDGSAQLSSSPVGDVPDPGEWVSESPREGEQNRIDTLEALRAIVADLGSHINTSSPHKTDHNLLSLYGMSLLYLSDLETADETKAQAEEDENSVRGARLRERARECFATLLHLGGPVDDRLQHILDLEGFHDVAGV